MVGLFEICVEETVGGCVDIIAGLTSGLANTFIKETAEVILGALAQSPISMEGLATLLGK